MTPKRRIERALPVHLIFTLVRKLEQQPENRREGHAQQLRSLADRLQGLIDEQLGATGRELDRLWKQLGRVTVDLWSGDLRIVIALRAAIVWQNDLAEQGFMPADVHTRLDPLFRELADAILAVPENRRVLELDAIERQAVELADHMHRRLAALDYFRRQVAAA